MPKRKTQPASAKLPTEEVRKGLDAFANGLARLGWGTPNLVEGTSYPLTRFQWNYMEIISLYRSSWVARKVIDSIAEDMLKKFPQLSCEITPKEDEKFQRVVKQTMTGARCLKALKWGRLFGGAAAVMVIKGHEDRLDTELVLDEVPIGGYKGLLVMDRWSGITPGADICYDIDRPLDFGLPESYKITTAEGQSLEVHASRVLRFTGRDLTEWESQAEQRWGLSEFELLIEEIKKRDNTSFSLVNLMYRANLLALKMPDLGADLSLGTAESMQRVMNVMQAQNLLASNQSMIVLPDEGELTSHQYSFGGLADLYGQFMCDISGAAEIPMTRLFGRTSSGLGASDEESSYIYYDSIGQKQNNQLTPVMDKLFPVIAMSTWGHVPEDLAYTYPSPRTMSLKERVELSEKSTQVILAAKDGSLISPKVAMIELKKLSDETDIFTSIPDEDIAKASADVEPDELTSFNLPSLNKDMKNGELEAAEAD